MGHLDSSGDHSEGAVYAQIGDKASPVIASWRIHGLITLFIRVTTN